MLDHRFETFLTLCRLGSFTRTAEALHITQPAVTQHIKYLEELYGVKLVAHEGKTFSLTARGELLRRHASVIHADAAHLKELLAREDADTAPLVFGATRTIGEFIMPGILIRLSREQPRRPVTMLVENTHTLLGLLDRGQLQFALVEGLFDKTQYESITFSREDFVVVAAASSPLCGQPVPLSQLLEHRLLLREPGSGSRDILELVLARHNLRVESFAQTSVLGSIAAIKAIAAQGLGVSFLYRAAVDRELGQGDLGEVAVQIPRDRQDFSFVFLQNSRHRQEYLEWFRIFQKMRHSTILHP